MLIPRRVQLLLLILGGSILIIAPFMVVSFLTDSGMESAVLAIPPVAKKSVIKQALVKEKSVVPTPPSQQPAEERPLGKIIKEKGISDPWSKLAIMIDKSQHKLELFVGGILLKSYKVEFGDGGADDKEIQGDHKTPEGTFYIAEKSVLDPADEYLGTRWLRLSYPNNEDAERGIRQGLIDQQTHDQIITAFNHKEIPPQDTALGGGVGIHGGNSVNQGSNWTWGCVGLTNKDVEDLYDFVAVGTPVVIQK